MLLVRSGLVVYVWKVTMMCDILLNYRNNSVPRKGFLMNVFSSRSPKMKGGSWGFLLFPPPILFEESLGNAAWLALLIQPSSLQILMVNAYPVAERIYDV